MTTEASSPHPRQAALAAAWPSVNALAAPLVSALLEDAGLLRLGIERLDSGAVIIDAGIDQPGGLEAGRRIAEICMGGLGRVAISISPRFSRWPWQLTVHTANPVLACLGSQYAGWSLSHGEGKQAFRALGSGPGRAAAGREALFAELAYHDRAQSAALVLEVDKRPPEALGERIARDCAVSADRIALILTPTGSLAGGVQIVARVLEVALHKAHTLGFPLHQIVDGLGAAPLPPPARDFLTAMGRTNDAILFGGDVQLFVDCDDGAAEALARSLPASASKDYGRPFAEIFKGVRYDFYSIDPHLFAPARATVTAVNSGRTFHAGAFDERLLDRSFGG